MAYLIQAGLVLLLAVALPWVIMRMLIEALEKSPKAQAQNYAGRTVVYGLGIVWLVWAAILTAVQLSVQFGVQPELVYSFFGAPVLLVFVTFALGLFDDAYGTSESRGFKGHLKALAKGKLTTGGLKLFGISLMSFIVALQSAITMPWSTGTINPVNQPAAPTPVLIGLSLVAGASIALTSNFLNLADLRPGRASKVYLILLGVAFVGALITKPHEVVYVFNSVLLFVLLIGPVLAVLGFDLKERAMLGDAGANPMGAIAAYWILLQLNVVGLFVYFAIIVALNFASEKVSFSKVIAGNRALLWLDNIGRLTYDSPTPQKINKSSDEDGPKA